MHSRFIIQYFKQSLAALGLTILLAACGGGGNSDPQTAIELSGTWDNVQIEALGTTHSCPGTVAVSSTESISCSTTAVSLLANGTFVIIDTTDELGNPYNERSTGTWSVSGNTLTLTETMSGPDAANLVPTSPPVIFAYTWSISNSGNALTGIRLTITLNDPRIGTPVTVTSRKR